MAAINICSDFGAQKNKVSLCFHSFPIYLPWSNGTPWNASSFLDITEHSQGTEWRFEPILFTFYRMLEPRCLVLFHEALESKVYNESESEVTQSCLTPCNPMDCNRQCSSMHGIFQARVLEWGAIAFSRESSQPRGLRTGVSHIVDRCFTVWATRQVRLVKSVVFPVAMYQSFQSVIKKAERWRTDTFELWCWRRLLRVPWTARSSHQS